MRALYGTVVIDAGSVLDVRILDVLDRADEVVLVLTPDIPSLRLLHAALQVLSESGSATDRAMFVVNQVHARQMISGDQIEEHLGIKIGLEVPYDGEGFLKAVNEGQPLVTMAHRSNATTALRRLATQLTNGQVEVVASPAQGKTSRFKGLLSRS
jgi:pilus assembly protein CpaE